MYEAGEATRLKQENSFRHINLLFKLIKIGFANCNEKHYFHKTEAFCSDVLIHTAFIKAKGGKHQKVSM